MLTEYTAAKEEELIGFVYEIEDKGWVKGIGISTGDEAYVVEVNEWAEKLSREVENDVRVTGVVTRGPGGFENRITVTGYELLNLEDPYTSNFDSEFDSDEVGGSLR